MGLLPDTHQSMDISSTWNPWPHNLQDSCRGIVLLYHPDLHDLALVHTGQQTHRLHDLPVR